MKFDILELGAKVKGNSGHFEVHLPGMDPDTRVLAVGSFCNWEPENAVSLKYDSSKNIWKGTTGDLPKGEYEYAFLVKTGSWYSNLSSDPFAKRTGKSGLSSFYIPYEKTARLDRFVRHPLDELILYKLNIDEFNENFEGVKTRILYYLSQLGINGIIFSPWIGRDKWGLPQHYLAPDSRYGTPYDLKVMINECHKSNIAVIMDMNFHQVSDKFGFNQLYPLFDAKPMLGRTDETGEGIYLNFAEEYTREFVFNVCKYWLDEYKVDGFRFLNSEGYWDKPTGEGFAGLCQKLYNYGKKDLKDDIYIFFNHHGPYRKDALNRTYANGVWNEDFIKTVHRMAENRTMQGDFWKLMDINQQGFQDETRIEGNTVKNIVLNATEDCDMQGLMAKLGVVSGKRDALGNPAGDRKNHWWKVKPYAIAQFTGSGIPVIFNGQEIGENRFVSQGIIPHARPIAWNYLADFVGKDMYRFYQKLILLRSKYKSLRSKNFFHYFTDSEHQVMVFKRYQDKETLIVALNFSNESYDIRIPFPEDGIWKEYLDDFEVEVSDKSAIVKIPARYGGIFIKK